MLVIKDHKSKAIRSVAAASKSPQNEYGTKEAVKSIDLSGMCCKFANFLPGLAEVESYRATSETDDKHVET